MPYSFPPDVRQQVNDRLATGRYATVDDVLREALGALSCEERETAALKEALGALDSGDEGLPLADAFAQVRTSHGSASDA